MPLAKENTYTTKDIYELPDGKRTELIDGQIYDMPPPNRRHQKLVMDLSAVIYNYIHGHNDSCEVYPAPSAVFLNKDNRNYVEPDLTNQFRWEYILISSSSSLIGFLNLKTQPFSEPPQQLTSKCCVFIFYHLLPS